MSVATPVANRGAPSIGARRSSEALGGVSASLVLTGERSRRRHLVLPDSREVWLPGGLFLALCKLVHARCTMYTGYVPESPLAVFRLRSLLDANDGQPLGLSFIETGDGNEYRLRLGVEQLYAEPSVGELPSPWLIPTDLKLTLMQLQASPCGIEIAMKPA